MGKMILHIGPVGPYYFFRDIIRDHLSGDQPAFLYMLPVNRAVRYLKKELISDLAPKTVVDPKIFTFDGLFRFLYQKMPQRKIIAGRIIRLAILNYLYQMVNKDLEYFRSGRGRLLIKIDQMLAELLEFGIYDVPDLEPPDSCALKYNDFQKIIRVLFDHYGDTLIDEYALPDTVVKNLDEAIIQKYLGERPQIYVNGYGIYTPPMIRLLERLKIWCDIEIKLDFMPGFPNLFRHTRDAYEMLRPLADQELEYRGGDPDGIRLFSSILPDSQPRSDGQKYGLLPGKNPQTEVIQIAAKIRQWHLDQVPLHQIGVTFPNLEAYAPIIRRVFRRFKIPFNLSTGFALAQSPLILAYLQVFEIVLSGFGCTAFNKLLISPFCGRVIGIDSHLFMRLTTKLRVRSLTGNWHKRFLSVAKDTQSDMKISRDDLQEQINRITEVLNIISRLQKPEPVETFYHTYLSVLRDLDMLNWYDRNEMLIERELREKEFRAFNRFMKIIEQLRWILTYIYQENRLTTEDFYRYLRPVLQESTYNIKEWSGYGVQIMPRLEVLSLNCTRLIVGGLIEGDFPRRFARDIFFNDLERQQLGLNATEDLVAQDRFLFYQLMMSSAEKIVLTWPNYDGDTALLPSTFIENLSEIYTIDRNPPIEYGYNLTTAEIFLEDISQKLNDNLSDREFSDLASWANLYGVEHLQFWLDGIDHQLKKQLRNQVSIYEGNLTENVILHSILKANYSMRTFSVSALESYAFCPMQYFLQRILGLEEEEPPEQNISAREKGALIHRILFKFYTYLRENKATDKPWEFRSQLFAIAEKEFDQLPYEGLLWRIEKEALLGAEMQQGLLDRFLESERSFLSGSGYIPQFFELAFGPAAADQTCDPSSKRQPVELSKDGKKLYLTGKIDRIDTDVKGQAIILDYKLSTNTKGRRLPDMISGLSLQLPVYALAVTKILAGTHPVAAAYYKVRDALNCTRQFMFVDGNQSHRLTVSKKTLLSGKNNSTPENITFAELMDKTTEHVFRYVHDLTTGKFTHTLHPDDDRCVRYCVYNRICRKDVGKLRHLAAGTRRK